MTAFLVLLFPLLLMVFALLMSRVEERLRKPSVTAGEVEEFFDEAGPDDVARLINQGWAGALARFRLGRRPRDARLRAGRPRPPVAVHPGPGESNDSSAPGATG